jgi:uncharacterized protein YodC (DUF2158 family)
LIKSGYPPGSHAKNTVISVKPFFSLKLTFMGENRQPKFENGDTVILKSNGKRLTVTHRSYEYDHHYGICLSKRYAGQQPVGCSRQEDGIIKEEVFSEDDLELVI